MLFLQLADPDRLLDRSPTCNQQLSVRIILDNSLCTDLIVRPLSHEIEVDHALAATLAPLAPRFLQWHVKSAERVVISLRQRDLLRLAECFLRVEVLHAHELLLTELAEGLQVWHAGSLLDDRSHLL